MKINEGADNLMNQGWKASKIGRYVYFWHFQFEYRKFLYYKTIKK